MYRVIPLILVAVLCFFAGYTVGKKKATIVVTNPDPASTLAPTVETAPVEVVEAKVEPEPLPEVATPPPEVAPPSPDTAQLAQRAQQRLITLTDTQERSIQAEVLDVTESHLKVRRQSDFRIVQVPVQMLSSEDQAFAAYLWKEKAPVSGGRTPGTMDKEEEQRILEELFGGF